ncbi:MAG: EF2563 family selenium-dependent molybdenum hydroxylase system protein [Eubacterium sp.]|nr:EF2563 family selenium-dependent molybdenum hydroxylase system protein [Eubacterium sp.]MDD7210417.1 selenium-dependent molybdenum cofactor biosynthesis protein YqeB [Lachnospiraceae bacterium]MDY5498015.1 selenium-dependent molybdenum cofactor biosynthesis protein YqeB [Anaerobutyricum sp.]
MKKDSYDKWKKNLVVVRGGGDIATGIIDKLFQSGFPVLVLEIENPSCIRRTISFCEAVFDREMEVEGVLAKKADTSEEAFRIYEENSVPVMVDPEGRIIEKLKPAVVVDAILAKKNLGTRITDAPVVIGVGPGFDAGEDVDAVIETKRGHDLGRIIYEGKAAPNTGIPGVIGGYGEERVIHAPCTGVLHIVRDIGSVVEENEVIAMIGDIPVKAKIGGVLRGMIREGYRVKKGLKIADVDPRRQQRENCRKISDKARCVAGGVLEAILHLQNR